MFIHKNTEYSVGHCLGKYYINIPRFKFFKEYEMAHNLKNLEKIQEIARNLITEKENELQ